MKNWSTGNGNGLCSLCIMYLTLFSVSFFLLSFCSSVEGYKNYTVGDTLGWYDTLENPKVDYQSWAAGKTFSLGDFLIFNTDNNHSVIQTYNFTTYTQCDYEDAIDNDTIQWSSSNPSSTTPTPISVSVPLIRVGSTYFFSSDYDGDQCRNGQHLAVNITYGQGLPPSLKSPSAYSPAAGPESGDDDSVPFTVPFTLGPAHEEPTSDDSTSESASPVSLMESYYKLFGVQLCTILILAEYFFVY